MKHLIVVMIFTQMGAGEDDYKTYSRRLFYHFNENGIKFKETFYKKGKYNGVRKSCMKMERYHQRDYIKTEICLILIL